MTGKGNKLDSLASQTALIESQGIKKGETILKIPTSMILPNPFQPRIDFDKDWIESLADSIYTNKQLEPIIVTERKGKYVLCAGESRTEAIKLLEKTKPELEFLVDAVVRELDDDQLEDLAIIENVKRKDLQPIELSLRLNSMMDRGRYDTPEELAEALSMSRTSVYRYLGLKKLTPYITNHVKTGTYTNMGVLEKLTSLNDQLANKLFDQILVVEELKGSRDKALAYIKEESKAWKKDNDPTTSPRCYTLSENDQGVSFKFDFTEGSPAMEELYKKFIKEFKDLAKELYKNGEV